MAVTQYIGARYVPLFAEPIQWDSTKEYEPLTIVLYEGNSYTSRQAVPVGISITNDTYWAETGNYNAQVEAYRQEVRRFDERITTNSDNIAQQNEDLAAEIIARENADTNLRNYIDTSLNDFEVTTDKIADNAVTNSKLANSSISWDKLDNSLRNLNRSRDMLLEVDAYIDNLNGNDKTAELGNENAPFKTLEAAYNEADKLGNNFRFWFLTSGEYNLRARVIVGSVIHFFTRAAADVLVNIDTGIVGGGLFFYDTHLAVYGEAESRIIINTTANYIQVEGGTLWSKQADWKFNGDRTGYIYCIDGSTHMAHSEIFGALSFLFSNLRIENVQIHNLGARPGFQFVCGNCRTQGNSFQIDSNPNAGTQPAIRVYTSLINFDGDTLWTRNTNTLGYSKFCETFSSLVMITPTLRATWNSYSEASTINNLSTTNTNIVVTN